MNLISQLIYGGPHTDGLPSHIRNRVKPTNITNLILLFVIALPFVVISMIFIPPLAFIPLAGALACVVVIIATFLGGFRYARLLVTVLPVWEVISYNAMLSSPGAPPISTLYMMALALALTPFVMFDLREKGFLILSVISCAIGILAFPWMNDWLTVDYDADAIAFYVNLLETGWLSYLTGSLAIMVAISCVYGLAVINKNTENASEALRKEAELQKEQLEKEKLQREDDMAQLKMAQATEKKRQWVNEGIANLSDILRSNQEEKALFDNILSMIIKYLQANQGGLYVVNRDEDNAAAQIELKACYAYGRKKYLERTIVPGEGLLGQAYLEGETTHLTTLPQNFVKITSGLGQATPNALLIAPLKVNETVEGILEIATFKKFEEQEIEFVQKIGESIAAYIQNNRINTQTKNLLEQAQQQTETMRAQEEEMRQNMEELSATQEEMQRKEQEYQKMIQALESKLAVKQ